MIRFHKLALMVTVTLLAFSVGVASAAEKARKGGHMERLTKLLPGDSQDKLNLTDDQKQQVSKLQDEYQDKTKDDIAAMQEEVAKHRDELKQARQNKDKAAVKQIMAPVNDKMRSVLKVRRDYEAKVRDLLTDDQKKTFDEVVMKPSKKAKKPAATTAAPTTPTTPATTEPKKEEKKEEPSKDSKDKP